MELSFCHSTSMTGDALKILRTKHRLTQTALSELLGVHWNTVAKWEQGVRNIPGPMIKLVSLVLKASSRRGGASNGMR